MDPTGSSEQFVKQLTENQNRLYGYVFSLLGDHSRAADVLQETNIVLWRKIGEFDSEQPFLPWAFSIARFQVLAHVRDQQRDRLLLDAELVNRLSGEAARQAEKIESLREALRKCLRQLAPDNRKLVEQRYFRNLSIRELADATSRSVSAVKVTLLRCRRQLSACMTQRLADES